MERNHIKNYNLPALLPPRTVRTQMWMSEALVKKGEGIKFQYRQGGFLDHRSYFAANSFLDLDPPGASSTDGFLKRI